MCGRLALLGAVDLIEDAFGATREGPESIYAPSYNIAPSQDLVVVGWRDGQRLWRTMRWGLIPSWAKAPGQRPINARAEGVASNGMFRAAFAKRRCLVPASGFYEWQRVTDKVKVPHFFHPAGGGYWGIAGLWEHWKDPGTGEVIRTVCILTTTPNAVAARVHDRMPVILGRDAWDAWLAPETSAPALTGLLVPCPDAWVDEHPVSTAVNSPKNNDPSLVDPIPVA